MTRDRWTIGLAGIFVLFSLVVLFVWIPNDIQSGVVEEFRRQTNIGDSMAPSFVVLLMLAVSVLMGGFAIFRPVTRREAPIDRRGLSFILRIGAVAVVSVLLMLYTATLVIEVIQAFGGEIGTYRQLKDSFPYKYLGFVLGGTVMVSATIQIIEHKFSVWHVVIGLITVLGLIVVFDLPFDDVLLPPNGDF